MKYSGGKIITKTLKITGVFIVSVLVFIIVFPMLFPDYVTDKIKQLANNNLKGELSFTKANLSFFTHFPSLTLDLEDFLLKGSEPFKNDTLVSANQISLGINVSRLIFSKSVNVDGIYIDKAFVNIKVNKNGGANYNVYVSENKDVENDESSAKVRLRRIKITDTHLVYNDASTDILIDAKGFNYLGKGKLDEAIFDLQTEAQIESFDFQFAKEQYLQNKKVNAKLVTKINTNSLSFIFDQNDLMINQLPVDFKGKFNFLSNGYNLDFVVKSEKSQLLDFFTALPPQYVTWLGKTKIEGETDLFFSLKGKYIASENISPDVLFNMNIRNGLVAYNEALEPAKNIYMNLKTKLPALNPDKVEVTLDSIYFNLGKDYFSAILNLKGLTNSDIDAKIRSKIDLGKLHKTIGVSGFDLKGNLFADIVAKGTYNKAENKFPKTKGNLELTNASIKTAYYPNPIKDINFKGAILNTNGTMESLSLNIEPASFVFEDKPFYLTASLNNFEDINYNIKAKGELDISKIYKVFSQKGLDLEGYANADVSFKGKQSDATNGNYNALENKGTLELRNIKTTSEFLPQAFVINKGLFTFNQDKMNFTNFNASYGASNFLMNGYMENVINFALSENEILKGNFSVSSNYLNVDEFLSSVNENEVETDAEIAKTETDTVTTSTATIGVVVIPKIFDFNLNANFKEVDFQDLNIQNLLGNLQINQGTLSLKNVNFGIIGSTARMTATYKDETVNKADFDFSIKAEDFDIQKAYTNIKMFRNIASAAENAEGIVSLDYKVKGKLDGNMTPIYPSLVGGGTLSIKNVKMKGFKMFNVVSKQTATDAFKDPDLSKVDIKTNIKNNIINIEQFRFRVAGFRTRIEGQTSFDNQLNIKMRLGLPPLGIIGIPIKVTGTQDNPNVNIGKKTEDLEETEYNENDVPTPTTEVIALPVNPVQNDSIPSTNLKTEPTLEPTNN
ncbi:AsmA protein [Mariniflexile fucanivorans]|uniref:AsmA protein n=1 Tax=Mariniflexile fucanivorans TaxID=264023 RepID=A0A4R1RLT7_9FLAO|nr:AsmA-like C-terminal region-containing protein [Mariniflexile fucanivorans]TCL66742.1 AsmA protein [Mariniflexile fucanivorans]